MVQILEIKKDTEKGLGGGTSMELTSKGAGTYWWAPNPPFSVSMPNDAVGLLFFCPQ